jgi:hypothetical protein
VHVVALQEGHASAVLRDLFAHGLELDQREVAGPDQADDVGFGFGDDGAVDAEAQAAVREVAVLLSSG